jgi:hypothetical protein
MAGSNGTNLFPNFKVVEQPKGRENRLRYIAFCQCDQLAISGHGFWNAKGYHPARAWPVPR